MNPGTRHFVATARPTRRFWVWLHRWAGLYMALFLLVAGLTGSILAFLEPIDHWLNPGKDWVVPAGERLDPVTLYERALRHATPQVRMDSINLESRPGHVVGFFAEPRKNPGTGGAFDNVLREVTFNPYTGELVRLRQSDPSLFPITRENLLDFVFALHYRLALPGGIGTWLFGIAAIVWTIDCFVGAYLTFPLRRAPIANASKDWWSRWRPAWLVRWRGGAYKVNFDVHRAGGLWVWAMLFVLAWSSVGLNLGGQVYEPVMGALFDMRRAGDEQPTLKQPLQQPALSLRDALARGRELARAESQRQGFTIASESELSLDRERGVYRYGFKSSRDIGRYGSASVLFDANTGALRATQLQDRQRAGPWLSDWLFALHFGAVWGLPMQIFICFMGLVVATLSGTGVYVWWKKRQGRKALAARGTASVGVSRRGRGLSLDANND